MRQGLFILIAFFTVGIGFSQELKRDTSIIHNTVFAEAGGVGLWYSVNYERLFKKMSFTGATVRVGTAYFGDKNNSAMTLPVNANLIVGEKKHFLELGGGPTFLLAFTDDVYTMALFTNISYRYQNISKRGFMFRAAFNPLIGDWGNELHAWRWIGRPWGGISFGYGF